MTPQPLNIGILGTGRIVKDAMLQPAQLLDTVILKAIASRDLGRAQNYAKEHGIERSYGSYEELLKDPGLDAIYNGLPNGLHGEWSIKALQAGKHVLCEKPVASNAAEARDMQKVAQEKGLILTEAFHYRYHPLMYRIMEIINSGKIGKLKHINSTMCFHLPDKSDIRMQYDLAGGAVMDAGCYAINLARTVAQGEPEVVNAIPKMFSEKIDGSMVATLQFPEALTATVKCCIRSNFRYKIKLEVIGDQGKMTVMNPFVPQMFHWLTVKAGGKRKTERVKGESTYYYQLKAFYESVNSNTPMITDIEEGIKNMEVIDAIYRKAGLPLR